MKKQIDILNMFARISFILAIVVTIVKLTCDPTYSNMILSLFTKGNYIGYDIRVYIGLFTNLAVNIFMFLSAGIIFKNIAIVLSLHGKNKE